MRVPDAFLTRKDTELLVRFRCALFGTVEGACKLTDVLGSLPDPRLLLSAASSLESDGKHEEALSYAEKAAKLCPDNAEIAARAKAYRDELVKQARGR